MTSWWGGWEADPVVRQAMAYGASQEPSELKAAMDLVAAAGPKIILEIGCDRGGTLFAWGCAAPEARVLGITLADNSLETGGSGGLLDHHRARVWIGDSHSAEALDWVHRELDGERLDVLVLDGDHSRPGVLDDLAGFGPHVRPGGMILLHDITSPVQQVPPVEVALVWPELQGRFETEEIISPDGGFGWGVIHVRLGDVFE